MTNQERHDPSKPYLQGVRKIYQWFYGLWNSKGTIAVAVVAIIIAVLLSTILSPNTKQATRPQQETNSWYIDINWQLDSVNDVLDIISLIIVCVIWITSIQKSWRGQLPEFLTASLVYKDDERLKFVCAPMLHGADIRQLAQTIFKEMCNSFGYLPIEPMVNNEGIPSVVRDKNKEINNGKPFLLHTVEIKLLSFEYANKSNGDGKSIEIKTDKGNFKLMDHKIEWYPLLNESAYRIDCIANHSDTNQENQN